jgi:protein-tyrosine phosphatase
VQIILNELYPNENVDVPDPYLGWPTDLKSYMMWLDNLHIAADK